MPDFGTLAVDAAGAPAVGPGGTQPGALTPATHPPGNCGSSGAGQLAVLPPALHPTSPPIAIWQLLQVEESPWGPFRLASIRVGARAATKSRSFLVNAFVDNPRAGAALRESWGFPCIEADVRLRVGHDRISGWASVAGAGCFDVELEDPTPIASGSVYYAPSMNLARTPRGTKLLQVDPEYLVKTVARGGAQVRHRPGAVDDRLAPTWPISATFATVDITLPAIRFVCDPDLPAAQGTENVTQTDS
ncbi:MAG: acetoacetate decarboxylase family protein [Pseudonocardia sp.]|nr:acetoacetate decarboxylase family protein [Pseudonocardia sp.]